MAKSYLDKDGLTYLWSKIKSYIDTGAPNMRKLFSISDSRLATPDLTEVGGNYITHFKATSTMTTKKPPVGDSHILHFAWDNSSGWDAQLALKHGGKLTGTTRSYSAAHSIAIRGMNNADGGTWSDWYSLLDLVYPVGSVYITTTNTNPSSYTLLGGGTWTLIKRVFGNMRADNPVVFNTANTVSGSTSSTFFLRDTSVKFRLRFTNKVALSDTSVTIGTLDLSYVGLTGAYYSTYIATDDTGNAGVMIEINSSGGTATIKAIDVAGGTSIAASTSTSPTITFCGELYFDTSSMRDADCNEFHWKRTA